MDKLNSDLPAPAVSEATGQDGRADVIARADQKRDLVDLTKALALYREAEHMHADLSISLKIAGSIAEQGRIPVALRELDQALAKFALTEDDRELVAFARIVRAFWTAQMDLRFRPAFEQGRKSFDEFVKRYPPREWKDWKLKIALHLVPIHSVLKGFSGAQLDPLPYDTTAIQEAYEGLVRSEKFALAYTVACLPNIGKGPPELHDMTMVDNLIRQPNLPALVRAEILQSKGTLALRSGDEDAWLAMSGEANRMFLTEGHRSGPLDIEMERLIHQHNRTELAYDELKSAAISIKDRFVELENWKGAKTCMRQLALVAIKHGDEETLCELNDQYQKMRPDCLTTLEWAFNENLILHHWHNRHKHLGKLVVALEKLYHVFEGGDMSLLRASVANMLSKNYRRIGDEGKAETWASRAAEDGGPECRLPLDDIIQHKAAVKSDGVVPNEVEMESLSSRLAEMKTQYARASDRVERKQIIDTILIAQGLYLERPFEEFRKLSDICFEAVRDMLPFLPPHDRATQEANLLDCMGGVLSREAFQQTAASWELLVDAYNKRAMAAGLLMSVGETGFQLSGTYTGLGEVSHSLWMAKSNWTCKGTIQDSLFQEADYFYRTSLDLVAKEGTFESAELAVSRLQYLWLSGLKSAIAAQEEGHDAASDLVGFASDQVRLYLERAKKMLETARRDTSTLSKSLAVLNKQSARATLWGKRLYSNAFELAMLEESRWDLWPWLQDSKARSASDLLALGINIPETLRDAVSKSPWTKQLFDLERILEQRLDSADGASILLCHRLLQSVRELMEQNELADAILALREGRPTTLEALQAVAQKDAEHASRGILLRTTDTRVENLDPSTVRLPRRVLFVDYGFHRGECFIVITDGDELEFVWVNVTAQEASQWKEDWLTDRPPDSPILPGEEGTKRYDPWLRAGEDVALDWLSRLAQPLLPFAEPGDLLVLCPSETLHGIPIHAATVRPEKGTGEAMYLIERNPVVYTASMTVTQQCMVRATSPLGATQADNISRNKNTILGVYRHPEPIRSMSSNISRHFKPHPLDIHIDTHLDRVVLQDALASSRTVLFFGHCSTETSRGAGSLTGNGSGSSTNTPTRRLPSQHLLLDDTPGIHQAAGDTPFPWPPPLSSPEIENHITAENPHVCTIEDVFATPVTASLVTLVACGSAEQEIRTGDEPLGLLTALLCSGANSVVGSMWPVEPRVGVAFAEGFYKRLTSLLSSPREGDCSAERDGDGEGGHGDGRRKRVRRMVDLAVVLQETVVELKRSRRVGFDTANVVDWGAFTLNGAWLLDVLDEATSVSP